MDAETQPSPTIRIGETTSGLGDGDLEGGLSVELPVEEILTGRAFGTGKSGSGKSNSAGVLCERLLDRGHPLLVVDVEGEYYSLKEKYEVLHVGADEEVDLRVGPEHAERLAALALEQNVPIVLDVSGYLEEDRRDELVYETVRHLFAKEKRIRRPFLLVVEEMHEFVPEGGSLSAVGEMLVRVAKRGRKRGLGILGLSQRPANVKKDYITQADWIVWHRLTWSNDTDVVKRVLDAEYSDAVEDLSQGEAFLQADFLEPEVRRVQFDRKQTFDAGATPGLEDVKQPKLKSISEDLVGELEEISDAAEQRQDELDSLRMEVAAKNERIDDLEDRVERLLDLRKMVDSADGIGPAERQSETVTVEIEDGAFEVPEVIQAEVIEIREEKRELEADLDELQRERESLQARVKVLEQELNERTTPEEFEALREDLIELVQRHSETLDIEAGGRVSKLEAELQEVRSERDALSRQVREEFGDIDELLAHETVRGRIDDVADDSLYADEHTWDAVTALAGTEWVGPTAVAPYMGVGEKSTGDILRNLASTGVAEKRTQGKRVEYRLDREALQNLVDAYRKRERLKAKREEINGDDS